MQRIRFGVSFLLSLLLHAALLLEAELSGIFILAKPPSEPILVEIVSSRSGLPSAPEAAPPTKPVPPAPPPAPRVKAPKVAVRPVPRPAPRPPVERARPAPQKTIDGVRIATAADIQARIERERAPKPPPPPVAEPAPEPAPPPPVAPPPEAAAPAPEPEPPSDAEASSADSESDGEGDERETQAPVRSDPPAELFWQGGKLYQKRVFRPGPAAKADAPGYEGRIFGEVSELDNIDHSRGYGRLHLMQNDGISRDYSDQSLFGFIFREKTGVDSFRQIETGRVRTYGAYLMVTDLYENSRLSTMGHTVVLVFPRRPPAGGNLYDVVAEGAGGFRLRGPNGAALVFDQQTQALRGMSGFVVAPPGDTGTAPQVTYRGLHVRIHAIGGNPFLRGRPATVVDGRGAECAVSTSDLFSYGKRRESDMFRYATDREFFSFLASRCPELSLPKPAEPPPTTRVAEAREKEKEDRDGGLFGGLFGRRRGSR